MFDVFVSVTPRPALTRQRHLRTLVRGALECWNRRIRSARLILQPYPGIDTPSEARFLCSLRLDLIARAPLRVVASAAEPRAAITLALRRAQGVLQGRFRENHAEAPALDMSPLTEEAVLQPGPGAGIAA